jgi:nicotinamide-nucleotide amidase
MTINVEILCIGNELLIGKIQNTNSHWLAQQITSMGANVQRITTVPDIVSTIAECIRETAARKPRFIITTGGLGPTFDDKTMQAAAVALDQNISLNAVALEMVKTRITEYFRKHSLPLDLEMTPPRLKMAMLPERAEVVVNPVGTAPSICAVIGESELYVLPGIPREMEAIFTQTIAPKIRLATGSEIFAQSSIFTEDIGESKLAPLIDVVMMHNRGVYVKSHPLPSEGKAREELHLTMTEVAEKNPDEAVAKASKELCALILENGGVILKVC